MEEIEGLEAARKRQADSPRRTKWCAVEVSSLCVKMLRASVSNFFPRGEVHIHITEHAPAAEPVKHLRRTSIRRCSREG